MKERPILFSAPMVRAILAGTKTQTRRIMKPQPEVTAPDRWGETWSWPSHACRSMVSLRDAPCLSPYGYKGDRLWVRESFSPYRGCSDPCPIADATYALLADGAHVHRDGSMSPGLAKYAPGAFDGIRWRPSIHMPRWASRIDLEVTGVRVERLHAISEGDARAEGVEPFVHPSGMTSYRDGFARLWSEINDTFDEDRWVWVVEFKRIEAQPNQDHHDPERALQHYR